MPVARELLRARAMRRPVLALLLGILPLACAVEENAGDDRSAGGKADGEDTCWAEARYEDGQCDACSQPDPDCWNWDAPVAAAPSTSLPLQASIHLGLDFSGGPSGADGHQT